MIVPHPHHLIRRHTLQAAAKLQPPRAAGRTSYRALTTKPPVKLSAQRPAPNPRNPKVAPVSEPPSDPPKATSSKGQTLTQLLENDKRRIPLIGLGLSAAVIGAYISMLFISMTNGPATDDCGDCTPSGIPADLRQGKISAVMFDKDLNRPESLMGIKKLRKLMGGLARGHVLEVAVGTGRNVEYIDWDEIKAVAPPVVRLDKDGVEHIAETKSALELAKERMWRRVEKGKKGMTLPGEEAPEVDSYTGVDVSMDVLEVTWSKLKKSVPELIPRRRRRSQDEAQVAPTAAADAAQPDDNEKTLAANIGQGRIRLYKADAQLHLPPPPALVCHDGTKTLPAPRYYDTVLQNFGLCSVADPQKMLERMAAVLQPETGRIYLLEHGRGSYNWLNGLLDKFAPWHFVRYGCWWNRDIEQIVRKAEQEIPGLEVVRLERPLWTQVGTVLWIELKVNPDKTQKSA